MRPSSKSAFARISKRFRKEGALANIQAHLTQMAYRETFPRLIVISYPDGSTISSQPSSNLRRTSYNQEDPVVLGPKTRAGTVLRISRQTSVCRQVRG